MLGEVENLSATISAIESQSGNGVLSFPFEVTVLGMGGHDHEPHIGSAAWGMLRRNRFDPLAGQSGNERPYGLLVNLQPDVDNTPYITPRWLKLSLRKEFDSTILGSVEVQRLFIREAGLSCEFANKSFYPVQVQIAGRSFYGTVSTHLGRSIESIVKKNTSDFVMGIASAAYRKAAYQVLELYSRPQVLGSSAMRHYYQIDPNPGNILIMSTEDAKIHVVVYDLTNKGKVSTRNYMPDIADKVFANFRKGAKEKRIPFPASVQELYATVDEADATLQSPLVREISREGF